MLINFISLQFILISNSPFFVQETSMELDIISDSPDHITVENIEHFPPFEVKDTCIIGRHNIIFKEFIYVRKSFFLIRLNLK